MSVPRSAAGFPSDVIDGVPALWSPVPGPLRATLVFGVGQAHETLRSRGLTHLVEHLALSGGGENPHAYNGSTELTTCSFAVAGSENEVADHLGAVCEALSRLPTDRLEHERGVLFSEAAQRVAARASDELRIWRFGPRGFGLPAYDELALHWAQDADVRDWATRFGADNAVLCLSQPPPAGLRLPLPPSAQPVAPPPLTGSGATTPGTFRYRGDGVALSLLLPRAPAAGLLMWLLHDRLEGRLRHELGVSYGPQGASHRLDAATRLGEWFVPCLPERSQAATEAVCEVLHSLCASVPTDREWERLRAELAMARAQRTQADVLDDLHGVAGMLAHGHEPEPQDEFEDAVDRTTPEQCQALARDVLPSLVIGSPSPDRIPADLARPLPRWSADHVSGRRFRASLSHPDPRARTLTVGEDGITVARHEPAERITVRYAEAAAALTFDDSTIQLVGEDGFVAEVAPEEWNDGSSATALILSSVPEHVRVPVGGRAPSPPRSGKDRRPTGTAWAVLALSFLPLTGLIIAATYLLEYRRDLRGLPRRALQVIVGQCCRGGFGRRGRPLAAVATVKGRPCAVANRDRDRATDGVQRGRDAARAARGGGLPGPCRRDGSRGSPRRSLVRRPKAAANSTVGPTRRFRLASCLM